MLPTRSTAAPPAAAGLGGHAIAAIVGIALLAGTGTFFAVLSVSGGNSLDALPGGGGPLTGGKVHTAEEIASLSPAIEYGESPYTNVARGRKQLCDAHKAAEARPSVAQWESDAKGINEAWGGGKLKQQELLEKLRIWQDAGSGVAGRDRVLCVGTNQDPNVDRIALVWEKWAKRCDRTLLFVTTKTIGRDVPSDVVVEMHPLGGDDPKNMWQRLRFMVNYLAEWPHLREVDFITFFGDDTYVFVKNLKAMLREPHYAELDRLGAPMLLGHRMVAGTSDIFVSNAVFVMNQMVLRTLHSLFAAGKCDPTLTDHTDDLPLAQCLLKVGIYAYDTYDRLGEDRTTPFNPSQVADMVNDNKASGWYPGYRGRPLGRGRAATSMFPVAFHYTDLAEMDRFEARFRGLQ